MKIKLELEHYRFGSGGLDQIEDTADYIKKDCEIINEKASLLLSSLRKVGPELVTEGYYQIEEIIHKMIEKTANMQEEMKELSDSCKEFVRKIEEINKINFD